MRLWHWWRELTDHPVAALWNPLARALRYLMEPRFRFGGFDPTWERTAAWRSAWAEITVVAAAIVWRPRQLVDVPEQFDVFLHGIVRSATIVGGCVIPPCLLLIAVASPGERQRTAKAVLLPLALLVGTAAFFFGWIAVFDQLLEANHVDVHGIFKVLLPLAIMAAMLWLMLALAAMIGVGLPLAIGSQFRAVDGHPTMRALTALAMAIVSAVLAAQSLSGGVGGSGPPLAVTVLLLIGGPMSTGALALWELHRLRARGITVRSPLVSRCPTFGPWRDFQYERWDGRWGFDWRRRLPRRW